MKWVVARNRRECTATFTRPPRVHGILQRLSLGINYPTPRDFSLLEPQFPSNDEAKAKNFAVEWSSGKLRNPRRSPGTLFQQAICLSTESMVAYDGKAHCGNWRRHGLAPYLRRLVDYGSPRWAGESQDRNTDTHQTICLNATSTMITTKSISCNPPW